MEQNEIPKGILHELYSFHDGEIDWKYLNAHKYYLQDIKHELQSRVLDYKTVIDSITMRRNVVNPTTLETESRTGSIVRKYKLRFFTDENNVMYPWVLASEDVLEEPFYRII